MAGSTTIRVPEEFRDRLRKVAAERHASMTETLLAALDALRREEFFDAMAGAEAALRSDPAAWAAYQADADQWLRADLDR